MAKLISLKVYVFPDIILASEYDASFEAIKRQLTKSIPNGSAFSGHPPPSTQYQDPPVGASGTNNIRSSSITSGRVTVALGLLLVLLVLLHQ